MPSSVIKWFKYSEIQKELMVVFVSGVKYVYKNVPENIYKEFISADSKGRFLNAIIKPAYPFQKADDISEKKKKKNKT